MEKSVYLNKIAVWDKAAAHHILSRTLFGFTQQDVAFALSKSLDDFIDNFLLGNKPEPQSPTYQSVEWVNSPNNNDTRTNYSNWFRTLIYWWYDLMLNQGMTFREKVTIFLHNHFVSEYNVVQVPQFMFHQNKLFRQYAFGNFKEITKKVTIDPAMLIYLNGNVSTKTKPNENYARELLELFTIGIGNYTENDIKEAARALTGWRINNDTRQSYFDSTRFDSTNKTFLGQTGNFGYQEIVDIIFQQPKTAEFLCRKLYKEFIHYETNNDYVLQLANVMRTNNYEMKPVLSTLLKSQFFHSEDVRGAKIKSPIEITFSAFRQFNLVPDETLYSYVRTFLSTIQQDLFNPPDVRGWEGQRKWISSNTYPTRNNFTDSIINGKRFDRNTTIKKVDVIPFTRSFSSSENAVQFIEDISKFLIQFPLSTTKKNSLLQTMLDGTAISNWSTYDPLAEGRLKNFYKYLMRLPEFQLL